MLSINYPQHNFKFKEEDNKEWIFDEVRRKWVRLTPEEWVRQNFLQYLVSVKKYPSSLIAVEKEIQSGELKKRCDIVVYKQHIPWMIIECKAPEITISEHTIQQILGYNISLQGSILVVTNGMQSFAAKTSGNEIASLNELPYWE